jgi:dTDP-4-dehydrorhamnose 3,5-epimerase
VIDGVRIKPLREIADANGGVQHMVRSDESELFVGFGEIYFSFTNPGVVKGWHVQVEQTNLLSCVCGRLRLVLHDARSGSPTAGETAEIRFSDGDRKVVRVPPGIVYGWKNEGDAPAILANCASHPHDPAGSRKIPIASAEVPYVW